MSELVWFVPVDIFYGYAVYHIVVAYEEYHLKEKYGMPYIKYLKRVPCWIPRITLHLTGTRPDGETSRVRTSLLPSLRAQYHSLLIAPLPLAKKLLGQFGVFHLS